MQNFWINSHFLCLIEYYNNLGDIFKENLLGMLDCENNVFDFVISQKRHIACASSAE